MKEITECISDIGRANSSIFSTLDLTSGFWQMKLDKKSQPLTAFTIPGKGQFHWVISPMGLLGCPASFQRLMEGVLRNLQNVIVYIDDLLVHSDTHERHLQTLEQVLQRLQ
jgi:Reverse transcriptase (RNA-dependent DNA polymerase)